MKAKVRLTDNYTGRSMNLIVRLVNTEFDKYEFSYGALSDYQQKKIENYFGKMNAYYTSVDILNYINKNEPCKITMYKVTAKTNGWIASHDVTFNGKTEITLADNLTLPEAQKRLLEFYNNDYSDKFGYAPNWGIAGCCSKGMARPTSPDGTRSYEYDSRYYSIEEN